MLNVGILGLGMMGRVHLSSYQNIEGVKVAAVCDLSEDRLTAAASSYGVRVYKDYDRMMAEESLDIVDICLPTFMHKEYALRSMDQKKHVFCEKPIASSLEDAEAMLRAANENNVKFSVGQVVRFFPAYDKAAKNVADGKIGTPKLIRTTRTGSFPSGGVNNWYKDPYLSGGVLMDLVIHDFDWIRHCFGEVDRVYARSLFMRGFGEFDHALVTLRLKNGAVAHIEGSWAYPPGALFGTTFEIIGTKGQIEFDSRSSVPVKKHLLVDGSEKVINDSPVFKWEEPYTLELQDFIDSINQRRMPAVNPKEAIKALEISLAAIESAKSGRVVSLGGDKQ